MRVIQPHTPFLLHLHTPNSEQARTSQIIPHAILCHYVRRPQTSFHRTRPHFAGHLKSTTTTPPIGAYAKERVSQQRRSPRWHQQMGLPPRLRGRHCPLTPQSSLDQMRPRGQIRKQAQPRPRCTEKEEGREPIAGMSVQGAGEFEERWSVEG